MTPEVVAITSPYTPKKTFNYQNNTYVEVIATSSFRIIDVIEVLRLRKQIQIVRIVGVDLNWRVCRHLFMKEAVIIYL